MKVKYKKKYFILSLLLLLSLASGSCKRIANKNESKEVILASFTVLEDIISNVVKDEFITVIAITSIDGIGDKKTVVATRI